MEFKDRIGKYPNRRKITILEQRGNEIVADIELKDEPDVGDEGTALDAATLNSFQSKIDNALSGSIKAVEDSTYARNLADEVAANLADRGASIYVNDVAQNEIRFSRDPQSQIDEINHKILWERLKVEIFNAVYPVGSIYISLDPNSPITLFGGDWEALEEDKTLWTARWLSSEDESLLEKKPIDAGLPNIQGSVWAISAGTGGRDWVDGAFRSVAVVAQNAYPSGGSSLANQQKIFNAHEFNDIYGNSTTVQPPAYRVYMWKRTKLGVYNGSL